MSIHRFLTLVIVSLLLTTLPACAQTPPQRQIAITIDDLPAASANSMTGAQINEMTAKLLATLQKEKVPAVGFVNERGLYKLGEVDERIKALNQWLDGGFELGNHTFGHTSLNQVSLQAWEDDVIRGETVTRILLAQHHMKMRYLRHPYLHTGRDVQTLREAEAFLVSRGYRIAPVTLDAGDWMYAGVYEDARRRGDTALQQQLISSYFTRLGDVFDYYEKLSKDLLGYEPRQILLLHANWVEADHIAELLDALSKRGYQFISLEDALNDAAYSLPDEYVGEVGRVWIDHWAISRGHPQLNAPGFPQWLIDRAKALPQPPPQDPVF
jgi:peptidoglycan/xylan/chitin deacetylase (PgdA/CDA1 family)